jgi:predicted permease
MKILRKLHRWCSPWIFILLFVTLATGIVYRIGRAWFDMSRPMGNKILSIHAGEWLGEALSPYYVILTGGSLLALIVSGLFLAMQSRSPSGARRWHRLLGLLLMLPLTASALTGILFKVGEDWFHFSEGTLDILMSIHQGSWLGKTVRPFYVLFVGLGLLALGWYGLRLTKLFSRKRPMTAPAQH